MANNENNNTNALPPGLSLEDIIAAAFAQSQDGNTDGEGRTGAEANNGADSRQRRSQAGSGYREKLKMGWEELKRRIRARLSSLDQEKLKNLLLAAGLGVAAVAAVLLILKLMPLGLTLLALVGLGLSLHLLERLRWLTVFF